MNLFLIGYRGTGKTTLGKIIASKLNLDFIDLDELIVKNAGKSIPEIFAQEGEPKFREYETQALEEACLGKEKIVSCGGGIITKEGNINLLKKNGFVVLLKANPETIFKRIYNDKNRPALTNKNPLDEIKHMLKVRNDAYEKAKDFEINTDKEKKLDCTKKILEEYRKRIQKI
ncbi:MAG: shikimate kinase [archaeon]